MFGNEVIKKKKKCISKPRQFLSSVLRPIGSFTYISAALVAGQQGILANLARPANKESRLAATLFCEHHITNKMTREESRRQAVT